MLQVAANISRLLTQSTWKGCSCAEVTTVILRIDELSTRCAGGFQ